MKTARQSKTPAQRAEDVRIASLALATLIPVAQRESATYGETDPRAIEAWEAVEKAGAVVHRQSRLLAGKSRGG